MQARYRFRIESDLVQRGMLARTFGCARVVFNDVIRCQDEAFRSGISLSPTEVQRRAITEAKNILAAGRAERQNAGGAPVSPSSEEVRGDEAGSTRDAA